MTRLDARCAAYADGVDAGRRRFVASTAVATLWVATGLIRPARAETGEVLIEDFTPAGVSLGAKRVPKIVKTEAAWRAGQLSPEAFEVTRQSGTERAFTGLLKQPFRAAFIAASAAIRRCSIRELNSSPAPAGRASGSRSPKPMSRKRPTTASASRAQPYRAGAATRILAMSSTTARSRRACATA